MLAVVARIVSPTMFSLLTKIASLIKQCYRGFQWHVVHRGHFLSFCSRFTILVRIHFAPVKVSENTSIDCCQVYSKECSCMYLSLLHSVIEYRALIECHYKLNI